MIALGITLAAVLVTTAVHLNQPHQTIAGFESELIIEIHNDDPATVAEFDNGVQQLIENHPDIAYTAIPQADSRLVQLIGADPTGTPLEQRYELSSGTWPIGDEVALTSRAADRLASADDDRGGAGGVGIGSSVTINETERVVSAVFEDRWAIHDALAIVAPATVGAWSSVTFRVPDGRHPLVVQAGKLWGDDTTIGEGEDSPIRVVFLDSSQTGDGDASAVAGAYLIGTVLALQIAILASAGFTVLAQRRTRQLGMLSAMGASPRRLAGVMRTTGLVVGAAGGVIGLGFGVLVTVAVTPLVQLGVPYRLDRFDLPWLALLPTLPLAVGTSLLAAWWPARRVRRMSAMDAIGARRPSNGRAVPAAIAGLVLAVTGTWLLIIGAPRNSPPLIVGGVVALTIGALLIIPIVIALLGRVAGSMALPVRIGWRDLNRNRSRSAAAAAAAAIAIAVPFGVGTFIASIDNTWRSELPADTVAFSGEFRDEGDATIDEANAAAAPLREAVPDLEAFTYDVPIDIEATAGSSGVTTYYVDVVRQSGTRFTSTAFANDELLAAMAQAPPADGVDVITTLSAPLDLPDDVVVERRTAQYSGFPNVLLINEISGTSRDEVIPGSWYLQKPTPFTQTELDRMEAIAERSPDQLYTSGFETKPPFLAIRAGALAVAGLLGLSVVAVAVALIRTENRADAHALNAIGASPRTSRSVGAATAVGLTAAAITVAIPTAFALLSGIYLNPDEEFDFTIPWLELVATGLLIPTVAGAGGSLLTTSQLRRESS
jgi:putative ABC transport system permease protein